jgi:hypothetical protein
LREEIQSLKEENKTLEYGVFDLLKLGYLNKEKLKRIRVICDD